MVYLLLFQLFHIGIPLVKTRLPLSGQGNRSGKPSPPDEFFRLLPNRFNPASFSSDFLLDFIPFLSLDLIDQIIQTGNPSFIHVYPAKQIFSLMFQQFQLLFLLSSMLHLEFQSTPNKKSLCSMLE